MSKPFIEGYIYAVLCLTTGDRYVGQSTRMNLIKSYHGSFGTFKSEKYQGRFKKDILENNITDKSELDRLEQKYIAEYRERYRLEVMWRNKENGGSGVGKRTEEQCHNQSIRQTGYCHTKERNKAIGNALRGKKQSAELIEKRANANRGQKRTHEQCKANRDRQRGISKPSQYVKCMINDIEYDRVKTASACLSISAITIIRRLNSQKFPNYIRL